MVQGKPSSACSYKVYRALYLKILLDYPSITGSLVGMHECGRLQWPCRSLLVWECMYAHSSKHASSNPSKESHDNCFRTCSAEIDVSQVRLDRGERQADNMLHVLDQYTTPQIQNICEPSCLGGSFSSRVHIAILSCTSYFGCTILRIISLADLSGKSTALQLIHI